MAPQRRYRVTETRSIEVTAGSPALAIKKADELFNPTAEVLAKRRTPLPDPRIDSLSAEAIY